MHYYKRNLGDYAKKAGRLTMLQHGAYTLIMDACYDREQFPTLEEAIDWTWASSKEEREAVEFVLTKFFDLQDGRYVQSRIQEELENYHQNAATNKRIAQEREAKRKDKNTNRAQSVDEPPPNHKPRTINQEPSLEGTDVPSCPPDGEPEQKPSGKKIAGCAHREVIELYHAHCPSLPRVEVWNDQRAGFLRQRWREVALEIAKTQEPTKEAILDWWKDFFQLVAMSDFLTGKAVPGKDRKPFVADLEWLIRTGNFAKVIEGRYHRK